MHEKLGWAFGPLNPRPHDSRCKIRRAGYVWGPDEDADGSETLPYAAGGGRNTAGDDKGSPQPAAEEVPPPRKRRRWSNLGPPAPAAGLAADGQTAAPTSAAASADSAAGPARVAASVEAQVEHGYQTPPKRRRARGQDREDREDMEDDDQGDDIRMGSQGRHEGAGRRWLERDSRSRRKTMRMRSG